MINRALVWGGLLCALLACHGCGGPDYSGLPDTVPASGVVLLNGQPVEGASIVFASTSGTDAAQAASDSAGKFSLALGQGKPGAVPGRYKVIVSKTIQIGEDAPYVPEGEGAATPSSGGASWENALPKKYASFQSSGLEFEVPAGGTSDLRIELQSAP